METITVSDSKNESVLRSSSYIDCLLVTSSGTLECSKILLASRSMFFHKIFTLKHNVGKFVNIVLTDCSFQVLKFAVDVILGLEVKINSNLLGKLKFILNKWQIDYIIGDNATKESDSGIPNVADREQEVERVKRFRREEFDESNPSEIEEPDNRNEVELPVHKETEDDVPELNTGDDLDSETDWTMTSDDVDVDRIYHSRITLGKKRRCIYKCNICNETCNMFEFAKKHYYQKHKDYARCRKVLIDADFEKQIITASVAEIRKLVISKKLVTDRNIKSELEDISNKILNVKEKINSITTLELEGAPTLERKRNHTLLSYNEIEKEICSINEHVQQQ